MPLLNAFIDSFVCVGFSSEDGVKPDPESKNNESFFTSDLQASILAIVTGDCATYPTSQNSELINSSYPPIGLLSPRSSRGPSVSSGCSTPISPLSSSIRIQKQHTIPAAYKNLPFFCFPDGIRATYQPEKEKIHHFVLTQDGQRSYALALTFQQQFTLKTDKPDDDGVYQISDIKLGRSNASKIPVAINQQKTASPPSPKAKTRSKIMPSSYPTADKSPARTRAPSAHNTSQQQSSLHYGIQTISSYNKNLSPKVVPPPSRIARARSQDNIAKLGTTSTTTTSSTGMRKRSGSIINKPAPISTGSSSLSSSSSSSPSTSTELNTPKPFYLPHCIVLISTQPYWTAMRETISIIHDEITRTHIKPSSSTYKKLIQRYAFLACNTPIPPIPWERFSLTFSVTNEQFVITFDPPINPNRPVFDLDLSILLLTLNIGKLLDVLAAIFTEQPIIFFSSNYSTLVTTLECLLYLIYPLKWTNTYVPLVPKGLLSSYLGGPPGLYIKGAHSDYQSIVEKLNRSFICNLDNDKNIHVPQHVELHRIPSTKINFFSDSITQLLEEIKVARALRNAPTVARLRMEQQRELDRQNRFETNQKITKIFLSLMIDLCGDVFEPIYWTVNPQTSPTNTLKSKHVRKKSNLSQSTAIPTFSKEKYLLPKREGIELEFYRTFVETIAFQNLLKEEMASISPTGFRQICQLNALQNEDQFYHFNNIPSEIMYDNNQIEPTTTLDDPLSSQMILPLPDWSSDLSTHYLDNCIDVFTNELKNAQQERSPAVIAVYSYLRGCARLARGHYLEGLRDLYSIENSNLFPKEYIETVIVPRLAADERLLDLFLNEPFYTNCPEWKKVLIRQTSQSMSSIDLDGSENILQSSRDFNTQWGIIENEALTYEQFSNHVHRLSIVLDQETTETLFKALSYWAVNSITKTLKKDGNLTDKTPKPSEPIKSSGKPGSIATVFTFQDTLDMLNDNQRRSPASTPITKQPIQSDRTLPTALFELFLDFWQETNAEKVRMNRHLPEDRQKQESILKVSSVGVVSKIDGPGQIILTQKRLYFLPETRSSVRLLTELMNITFVEKYQHQSIFKSSQPSIKIHTSSSTSSLKRTDSLSSKSKTLSLERESKSSSISLYFKTSQEQELWHTIIVELWSGLTIAHEQCDTALLNKASRHVALMDALANIDYYEETFALGNKQLTSPSQKSKQHHNEVCLELALNDLSTFTRMRGKIKPLDDGTRNVLTRRLSPSINELERHAVRCLISVEHPESGHPSLWCAYGPKLKVFNITTWICDPNDLCFPSVVTCMCLDARYKLWVRCSDGELFIVDTLTRRCEGKLATDDGENGCQTIAFDIIYNHILTANRDGTITVWNALNWDRLYDINLLEIYRSTHDIQERTYKSETVITLHNPTEPSNVGKSPNKKSTSTNSSKEPINQIDIPNFLSQAAPAQIIPSENDKLEHIQIYENLLFACYRDDYIIILRKSNSNTYTYEDLISVKYKTGESIPIDSFLVYNKQLWVSTGCIISIFNVNNTNDENSYNLLMKKPVDDDNLVTMLGFDGYIWAGSLNGNVYAFRMDNYELYKTYTGHRASVWCLCSMLDTYVVSGSAQNDTSIAIWENVQPPNLGMRSSSAPSATTTTPTAKGTTFNLQGTSDTSGSPKKRDTKNVKKPIDIL